MARIWYFITRDAIQLLWVKAKWKKGQQTERKPIYSWEEQGMNEEEVRETIVEPNLSRSTCHFVRMLLYWYSEAFFLYVRSFRLARKQHNRQKQCPAIASSQRTKRAGRPASNRTHTNVLWQFRHDDLSTASVCVCECARVHVCFYFQVYLIRSFVHTYIFFWVFVFFVLPLFHSTNAGFIWASR